MFSPNAVPKNRFILKGTNCFLSHTRGTSISFCLLYFVVSHFPLNEAQQFKSLVFFPVAAADLISAEIKAARVFLSLTFLRRSKSASGSALEVEVALRLRPAGSLMCDEDLFCLCDPSHTLPPVWLLL